MFCLKINFERIVFTALLSCKLIQNVNVMTSVASQISLSGLNGLMKTVCPYTSYLLNWESIVIV
jgi:hypothetical protein